MQALEKKSKIYALAGTIGFHALVLLLFIFIAFTTPIPPFPEAPSPGIEINFGNLVEGTGNTEDVNMGDSKVTDNAVAKKATPSPQPIGENIVTNDAEENNDIGIVKNNKVKQEKVTNETPVEKPVEQAPSSDLMAALNKMKNKKSGSSGGDGNSGNPGNSGDPNGNPNTDGIGGAGGGKGFSYNLKGRRIVRAPDIMDDSQEEGKVVVDIMVDETGKVVKAQAGGRGSTTTSALLYAKARQAALSAKFNPSNDGMKEQSGSITFVFILN